MSGIFNKFFENKRRAKLGRTNVKRILTRLTADPRLPALHALTRLSVISRHSTMSSDDYAAAFRLDRLSFARLIQTANCAQYAGPTLHRVEDLSSAIEKIGVPTSLEVVIAAYGRHLFRSGSIIGDYSPSEVYKHSLAVALCNRIICNRIGGWEDERGLYPFLSGMLHDVGLVMEEMFAPAGAFRAAIREHAETLHPLVAEENEMLGVAHDEVGWEVVRSWNFPEEVLSVIRFHHRPDHPEAAEHAQLIHVTRMSEWLVHQIDMGYSDFSDWQAGEYEQSRLNLGFTKEQAEVIKTHLLDEIHRVEYLGWFALYRLRRTA